MREVGLRGVLPGARRAVLLDRGEVEGGFAEGGRGRGGGDGAGERVVGVAAGALPGVCVGVPGGGEVVGLVALVEVGEVELGEGGAGEDEGVDGAEVDGADAAVVGAVGGVLCFEVEGADEGEGGEVGGVVEV